MLNWAVGREYLDRTPFRRGTEVLIRMELEDNKRRRRISEAEEAEMLAVASPHLRSMIIAALDTGMRRGEMLALRFSDIDWKRRMITMRGATICDWKRCRRPLSGWKEAKRSIRRSKPRTNSQESFKIPPNRASQNAKTPPRNPHK